MVSPSVMRATSCSACRLSALSLFMSSFTPARRPQTWNRFPRATAAYSTFRPSLSLRSGPAIEESKVVGAQPEKDQEGNSEGPSNAEQDGNADVPWYLQVEPPKHSTLLYEPPPLPSVPDGAPKIVDPLLKYLSEELGVDKVELLDLRELDPPAALGTDLMMLFGTARSERHLHVSAGRLVQWLRSRGINAEADGLLGRNELKTRLRRKARKEKLLGSSGGIRGGDDGISTGWVCVNLGTIGWTTGEHTILGPDGRTAGFGAPNTGSTVVIQMLTEARREELGLERLWNGILKKSRADQKALAGDADTHPPPGGSRDAAQSFLPGRRFFSTSTPRNADALAGLKGVLAGEVPSPDSLPAVAEIFANKQLSKEPVMEHLQRYIESLPSAAAARILAPSEDGTPNAFARVFGMVSESLPRRQKWASQVWLQLTCQKLGIPMYDLSELRYLVNVMEATPIVASDEQFLGLIQAVFTQPGSDSEAVLEQARLAQRIIETMHERGKNIMTNEVIVSVIVALLRSGSRDPEAMRILASFELMFARTDLPCPSEALLIQLLDAYADVGDWDSFWKTWSIRPRYCQPRSGQMYAYLYQRLAKERDQSRAVKAIRLCLGEMANEAPRVTVTGDVLEGLKACLRVADPIAETLAQEEVLGNRRTYGAEHSEFVELSRALESLSK